MGSITPALSVRASGASRARRQQARFLPGRVKKRQHVVRPRLAKALCTEAERRLHHADLLRDGCCDPLAQRHTAFLSKANNTRVVTCPGGHGLEASSPVIFEPETAPPPVVLRVCGRAYVDGYEAFWISYRTGGVIAGTWLTPYQRDGHPQRHAHDDDAMANCAADYTHPAKGDRQSIKCYCCNR